MQTCVSLNCPFIPFCNQYNYLVDRGDVCDVQRQILERSQRFIKDKKEIRKRNTPLAPIVTADTVCRYVICPKCKTVIYDSEWRKATQREHFKNFCLHCFNRLTEPSKQYLGRWENEIHSDKTLRQIYEGR